MLGLLAVPLAGLPVSAHAATKPAVVAKAGVTLEGIRAVETAGGATRLEIAVSPRPPFTTFKLEQPARIVLDLSGVRASASTFDAGTVAVGTVAASETAGEGGTRTRVVVTLRRAADYQVEPTARGLALVVKPHDVPAVAAEKAAPADAQAQRQALEQARKDAALAEERRKAAEVGAEKAEQRRLAAERALSDAQVSARSTSAAAAVAAAADRAQLEALREKLETQQRSLAQAESAARKSHELQDQRAQAARKQETERDDAARTAAAELARSRAQLDGHVKAQEAQRHSLAEAEKLVAAREAAVARASQDLARREALATQAAKELEALAAKANVSVKMRAEANAAVARATAEREAAGKAAAESTRALAQAVSNRRAEEEALQKLERARSAEEQHLAVASSRRATEEAKLAEAAAARRTEEARVAEAQAGRSKLEAERARLLADRASLVAELDRLRAQAANAKQAARPAPVAPAPVAPVAVAPAPVATPAPTAPARPRSVTLRPPSRVERIDFVDEPTRSAVIIDLDEPSQYAVEHPGGRRVSLRLYKTDLPRVLERSLDATEYLGPVRVISSYRDPALRGAVRIDVEMAEDVPNEVRVNDGSEGVRLVWNFRKVVATNNESPEPQFQQLVTLPRKIAGYSSVGWVAPTLVAQAAAQQQPGPPSTVRPGANKKRFTGRRIDLDFKSADIHNILHLLADVGGVNVVTSDDVKGEVTIKMRDVPWDQALDVVLRQKQLGQVREGNLVRVAPLQVLEKELEQEIARQKQITEVLPTETRLIGVSYAEAKQLTDRVKDLLSPRGKVSVDERTNTLIVSDVGRNLALVEELVRNLDTQTSQVVIEARIVEARSTFVRQIGVQWGGAGFADAAHGNPTGLAFPNNIGIGGGATDGKAPLEGLTSFGTGAQSPNFAVNMPAPVGTGAGGAIGLTMGSVAGAFNLNLRLSAMESTGQVRILSSPRISTLDNTEASIEQGVSIPISVVSAQGVQTVFVDAKLNLTVKPHVTNEGTVMMEVKVTRNEPDFVNTGARGDPTILKKEANTKMLVRDGDTAVIGGIYQRNSGLSYSKVPYLADIPVLGLLFRARKENDDRTEFLVFITPRIANRARALGQ
jgi:type IV pilus assembly protein PilQ